MAVDIARYRREPNPSAPDSLPHSKDKTIGVVIESLIDSTLGFGLIDAQLHISKFNPRNAVLDIWSQAAYKKRTMSFIRCVQDLGYDIEVRQNPILETPVDTRLYSHDTDWSTHSISRELAQRLRARKIIVKKDSKFEKNGRNILIDTKLVREWILEEMPESIEVRSIDFPEIRKNSQGSKRTVALITCTVPISERDVMNRVIEKFEDRFGIQVAINPVPSRKTLRERLEEENNPLSRKRFFTRDDLPELRRLLQTTLRWRTAPRGRKSIDMTDRAWISIDSRIVMLREDLIHVTKQGGKLRVFVAIPDITVYDGIPKIGGHKGSEGAFYLGRETNAWVFKFRFNQDGIVFCGEPFRAVVRNMRECSANEDFLRDNRLYQKLKRRIGSNSDYAVIESLMHATYSAVGGFLREKDTHYLVRHDADKSMKILKLMLVAEGITYGKKAFHTKVGIFNLMKKVQRLGKYHLLPLLAAQISGSTVVCRSDDDECGIKPQRGTRELLNQWILASVVDNWHKDLPEFLRNVTDQPALLQDAGSALVAYEGERRFAKMLGVIVGELTRSAKIRGARVEMQTIEGALCWIPEVRKHGLLQGVELEKGSKVLVTISSYDTVAGQFLCELARPQQEEEIESFATGVP